MLVYTQTYKDKCRLESFIRISVYSTKYNDKYCLEIFIKYNPRTIQNTNK